jgi:hypothetical protein
MVRKYYGYASLMYNIPCRIMKPLQVHPSLARNAEIPHIGNVRDAFLLSS